MLDKVQSFADGKYDLNRKDIENIYFEQRGDVAEQLEEMGITKRGVSTGMSTHSCPQTYLPIRRQ
jgi:amphiphysin